MNGGPPPTPAHRTLGAALAAAAAGPGQVTFVDLREQETALSWHEVYRRGREAAAALAALGVATGDRVALILTTGPAFLDAFFGATLLGAIPVPLSPPLRLGRLDEYHAAVARLVRMSGARLVVTEPRIKRLLGVAMAAARPPLGCVAEPLSGAGAIARERAADAVALVQFSSGSTVDPKPVALTEANLMAQLATIEATLARKVTPQTGVSWLPLHHDMGLIGFLLSAVYQGRPLVLMGAEQFLARPALWLRAVARHRATVTGAPSFAYSLCLKRVADHDLDGVDLTSLRFALNGAEPVAAETLARFSARFSRWGLDADALTPVYGLAEATLAVTFADPGARGRALAVDALALARDGSARAPASEASARQLASVGRPLAGVEVAVRDPDGHACAERAVGRIWVRGPSVMPGYFDDAVASARALVDGWLDTGDLGFVADGELYVCGRAKDVVIIHGANHAPQEFEECLDEIAGLRAGCAVALGFTPEDAGGAEQLLILAEHGTGAVDLDRLAEEVAAAVLRRTGVRPHTVVVLPGGTLPRTSSGKLRRAEALRRFTCGELTAPRQPSALGLAAAMARSTLAFAKLRVTRPD